MPYVAFHELCPGVASRETRIISVFPASKFVVPRGDYHFIEMFCDEPKCDCRRVFFSVYSPTRRQFLAVIAWGWENRDFYMRWLGIDNPYMASEMQGPILNPASPQSEYAEALLELAQKILLVDPMYLERIKRHYALFRLKIGGSIKKTKKARREKAGRKGRT